MSGLCIFSKVSLQWDGNKMKSGTGRGVPTLVKLETKSFTSITHYLVLAEIHH